MAGTIPLGVDAHIDVPLSNLAVRAFDEGLDQFVGDQLFPVVPVGKQSDKYYTIDKEAFLRVPDTLRAPRTRARKVQFQVSSDSYFADNYALAAENALEDLANADIAIQLRENSTRLVVSNLRRDQEVRIANMVTSISNVGSGATLVNSEKWSDANSSPISQVNTGFAFVERQTGGLSPNLMVIDSDTLRVIRTHPELLDLYKYTSGGQLTDQQLADVFGVRRILVGRGKKENSVEGGGASSVTNIWGNNVILAHIGPATGMQSQTFGLRFRWRNPIFFADFAVKTDVFDRAGEEKVEVLEAGMFQDEKIVAPDLAYVIAGTL